ncbi:MAG: hypothetical protein WDN06_17815 [Asticcacaulis sp.]
MQHWAQAAKFRLSCQPRDLPDGQWIVHLHPANDGLHQGVTAGLFDQPQRIGIIRLRLDQD